MALTKKIWNHLVVVVSHVILTNFLSHSEHTLVMTVMTNFLLFSHTLLQKLLPLNVAMLLNGQT